MKQLYNRYFPTPSYLAMNSFAVDISDQSIKYGELNQTTYGLHLGRFGKLQIPASVVVSGKIEQPEKIINILKDLKKKVNMKFVRVSMPEEQMYLFTLSLPKTDNGNIKDMISLQIEENIPLKASDTVFEYNIVSQSEYGMLVEVSAIAKSTIENYMSVFKESGLVPLSFELEAQAIARAVIPKGDTETVMIVDFGDTRTGVSIAHDGRVFFTTTLDLGGINLTNMIAKNFSISFEKAEEMKRSYGLDEISNIEDIFPVILNGISVLKDELNKQYSYWKDHGNFGIKHDKINKIILCGGDANLTGLSDYLEASMKIKVEHANAWINISDMKISVPDMSFEESLSYATVLGLALGGYSYSTQPVVNVLGENEKKRIKYEYWKRFLTVFSHVISMSFIIFIILLLPSYFYSVAKTTIVENRLDAFNNENKNLTSSNLSTTIDKINSNLKVLSSVSPSYSVYNDVLGTVLSSKVNGIKFSQIIFSLNKDKSLGVQIQGVARDRVALRNFKTKLDGNPKIISSDLPISDFLEKSDLSFTISLAIKK